MIFIDYFLYFALNFCNLRLMIYILLYFPWFFFLYLMWRNFINKWQHLIIKRIAFYQLGFSFYCFNYFPYDQNSNDFTSNHYCISFEESFKCYFGSIKNLEVELDNSNIVYSWFQGHTLFQSKKEFISIHQYFYQYKYK